MVTYSTNIFGNLHIARQGMMAQQVGLSVTGQNVTNANTEGYSRRALVLGSVAGNNGVEVLGVKRYTDEFATRRLIAEKSLMGFAEQKASVLSHVSDLFNDLDDTGLGAAFDDFFGALRLLESSPADLTVRQEILATGAQLSNTFNRIASELEDIRSGMDDLLRSSVSEINTRTARIAELNEQISLGLVKGEDVSDLQDLRDRLVTEISEHADVTAITNSEQQMTIFLEGGLPLVDGNQVSTLRVSASAAPGSAPIEYVASNGAVSDITSVVEGGAMGGALQARDTDIPAYQADLDQIAYDLVVAMNAQHGAGFGLDGVSGRDFFTALGTPVNAASSISLDAAMLGNPEFIAASSTAAGIPGDNVNALAMADMASQDLAAGGTMTFNESYATLVGQVGVDTKQAEDSILMRETSIESIEEIRDSQAGVSMDEELTNLIAYQRAYQASARVLTVIDQVIQSVLAIGG